MDERHQVAAQLQHAARADQVVDLGARRPQAFDDRRHRHHIGFVADLDDHAVHHGERERQRELDRHAAAAHRLERNPPADVLDIAAHDVHADAAAGNVGDRFGGRESRHHDEVVDLVIAEHRVRTDQPPLARLLEHPLGVDAGAVVADLDDDACRRDARPLRWTVPSSFLPAANRSAGELDAVVDRVADDMGQRIAEPLDDRAVDLGGLAGHFEPDFLGRLGRKLAHEPRHALEHGADWLRAHRHDAVFELARVMDDFVENLRQPAARRFRQVVHDLSEHGLRDHQFADHVDDAVDLLELDPGRGGSRLWPQPAWARWPLPELPSARWMAASAQLCFGRQRRCRACRPRPPVPRNVGAEARAPAGMSSPIPPNAGAGSASTISISQSPATNSKTSSTCARVAAVRSVPVQPIYGRSGSSSCRCGNGRSRPQARARQACAARAGYRAARWPS